MEEEPVFWWSMPSSYFEELIHAYHAKCIIDLSPGSGEFALAALQHKSSIQYLGICFENGEHQLGLMKHLMTVATDGMNTEGSPFYVASMSPAKRKGPDGADPKPPKKGKVTEPKKATPKKDPDMQAEEDDPTAAAEEGDQKGSGSLASILAAIKG